MERIKCFLIVETDEIIVTQTNFGSRSEHVYQRADTGEKMVIDDAPVGAIWDCTWYHGIPFLTGPDGHSYAVKTPGGIWQIDSKASNCTLPDDVIHKCWCRHGVAPEFTVDKIGNTCSAGAGSILCGSYHGFLRNGFLE